MSRRCPSRRRSRTRKRSARSLSDDEEMGKLRLGARPFHALVPYYMGTRVGVVAIPHTEKRNGSSGTSGTS